MAAKLMGQVWDLDLPHNEAWVLMALADHADHDGNNVFPGLELLAYKTGYSERQVRRILDSLEERGIAIPVSGGIGRGQRQTYRLDFSQAPLKDDKRTKCPVNKEAKSGHFVTEKADKVSTNTPLKADILTVEKRTFSTQKADILAFAYKEEPSIEPSVVTAAAIFEKFSNRQLSIQETDYINEYITQAQFTQWGEFVKGWFVSYPNSRQAVKVVTAFLEQASQQAARAAAGALPYNPKTHYSDGREKPKGIRGFVC